MAEKKRIIVRNINLDICHKIITHIDGTTKIDTPSEDTKRTLCSLKDTLIEKNKVIKNIVTNM